MTRSSAAAPTQWSAHSRWLSFAVGLLLGAGMLWRWYLPNMAPGILHGDMSELQYLSWKLGISHGTGFTVYVWLGHLLSHLPFGEPAWRVTLLSGVATAGAVTFVYMTWIETGIGRDPQRWFAAAWGAGALGYAYMIWRHAIVSEVYTLHLFFMAAVLWLAARWGNEQDDKLLYAGAFLWALSWGNHMMATALGPPLVLFCLCHRPAQFLEWRRTGIAVASFVAGIGSFVLLFWLIWLRDVPTEHLQANVQTALDLYEVDPAVWPSFWRQAWFILSGEQFRGLMLAAPAEWQALQWSLLPWRLLGQFLPVGVALGALGWATLWKRHWRWNVLLNAMVLTQLILNANYYMPWEIYAYYLPVYLAASFWLAAGALWLLETVTRPFGAVAPARWMIPAGCVLLIGLLAWGDRASGSSVARWADRMPRSDWRRDVLTSAGPRPDFSEARFDEAHRILESYGGTGGVYLGSFYHQYALLYLAETAFGMTDFMAYELSPMGHRDGTSPGRISIIEANLGKKQIVLGEVTPGIAHRFLLREIATQPRLWEVVRRK